MKTNTVGGPGIRKQMITKEQVKKETVISATTSTYGQHNLAKMSFIPGILHMSALVTQKRARLMESVKTYKSELYERHRVAKENEENILKAEKAARENEKRIKRDALRDSQRKSEEIESK